MTLQSGLQLASCSIGEATDEQLPTSSYKTPASAGVIPISHPSSTSTVCVHQAGLECPRNKQKKFRFEPKQTETKNKKFLFVLVFRTYIETSETNRTVLKQTEINQNNPKFSEKYQNMLSIKLFLLVFVCFSSIETSTLSVLI